MIFTKNSILLLSILNGQVNEMKMRNYSRGQIGFAIMGISCFIWLSSVYLRFNSLELDAIVFIFTIIGLIILVLWDGN